ncbi:MAG TPA: hypothetical protein VF066_03235 [Thermoleophilaceae bacterium]
MRTFLDQLLAAPGLTRARFAALAVLSLASTATVLAAGAHENRTPWDLVAAAQRRPAPVVEVTPRAEARPAPAPAADASVADQPADDPSANVIDAPAQAVADTPATTTTPAPSETPTTETTTPVPAPAKPESKIKHVFVVSIAGAADGSYLNETLRPQGRWLAAYRPLDKGELATEVALVAGQKPTPGIEQGCPTYGGDCLFPVETLTLSDQLVSKGKRWRGYFEGMPAACTHPNADSPDQSEGDYVTRRNPFVYFHSLTELGECQTNDLPLDSLATDLASADATPNLVYVGPKDCDAVCSDAFLANWVPQILDSAAYKADGLLVVLTDTGALLVSQFAAPGSSSETPYDPFGVLRSFEDLFGLDYLGSAGDATATSFAKTEVAAGLS